MKVMISGFYGFNNSGDEAVLLGIVNTLRKTNPNIDITVLTNNVEETEKRYGVRAIPRKNFWKIFREMRYNKLFISGGGSLLQDVTSTRSILYYLGLIWLAKKRKMKVMVYSNGIGPINNAKNRKKCKKILDTVDYITLRDKLSLEEIKSIGINEEVPVKLTPDPAFAVEAVLDEKAKEMIENNNLTGEYVCVSIRKWGEASQEKFDIIAKVCDYISVKYQMKICLIPFYQAEDIEVCNYIANKMSTSTIILDKYYSVNDLLIAIKNSKLVIGMRLHALIYAVSMNVPFVSISYDPKVDGIVQEVYKDKSVSFGEITEEKLIKEIEDIFNNYEAYRKKIGMAAYAYKRAVTVNAKIVKALLNED